MREHRGADRDPAAAPEPASPAVVRRGFPETVLRLQRQVGNLATRSMLGPTVQRQAAGTAIPAAVANANAEAAETARRIPGLLRDMLRSGNRTIRNTAQLYLGARPRLGWVPLTRRTDSAALARDRHTSGLDYFFTGLTQPPWRPGGPVPPGTHELPPRAIGTILDNLALIRGRNHHGAVLADHEMQSSLVHETSHALVGSYGQHPGTRDRASFDRYRDEFRAYFIDPLDSRFPSMDPDRRAEEIRRHLVGTGPTPDTDYPDLQAAYWTNHAFRTQVNAHNRPDGYNLTNSPRLDGLFRMLTAARTNPSTVDTVVLAITLLPDAERAEAASSSLIRNLVLAVGDPGTRRIRRALDAAIPVEYPRALNPGGSARVAGFYEALIRGDPAGIKATYGSLNSAERTQLATNPATMVLLDTRVDLVRMRACIVAMVISGIPEQFDAVDRFLGACLDEGTAAVLSLSPVVAPSARLLAAARAMTLVTRLALYRLSEDARVTYVESLPPPVSRPVIAILRGERNP